jgi:hypothetical protein
MRGGERLSFPVPVVTPLKCLQAEQDISMSDSVTTAGY